ncbi:GNAT family N-acetyltransferase [Thermoactinomyces sp. DSM 45892]|uniref:GNAT family N-acetyltransferase n=1 Tax=Thermoactinomyces sp. DSM 45892 TaxID=1882753 RepID=UPI000898B0B3|nr:GNAT family N-acetyltransferase [Thermoactinomyces sp. DSM 45892]SDZ08933.1 Ribosomal protein S18 acetylase RimI [Thermoactinomyces sp. DSM 45892]
MFNIRKATGDDLSAVQQVAQQSWHYTYRDIIPANLIQRFLDQAYSIPSMEHRLHNTYLYVVEQDDQLVGFSNFSKTNETGMSHLIAIYLLPAYIGQGLGKSLLQYAMQEECLQSAKEIELEVSTENKRAIDFYQSMGFRIIDEYVDLFFDKKIQTTKMIWTQNQAG